MLMVRIESTNEITGRITHRGRPLGLWWRSEGGYSAKCGPLGDFSAPTLEALLIAVETAETKRLAGVADVLARLRRKRQASESAPIVQAREGGGFARLLALYMLAFRADWPPLMTLGLGPAALLALLPLKDASVPAPASPPPPNVGR